MASATFNIRQPNGNTIVFSGTISEADLALFAPQLANLLITLASTSTPASA